MKIEFKSKKVIFALIGLLGVGTTAGVVAATTGGSTPSSSSVSSSGGSSSSTSGTSSISSSSSLSTSNEEQVIRDFEFENAQFNNSAYPSNFQARRFIDDGEGGVFAVGTLGENSNSATAIPAISRMDDNFESLWTLGLDLGYQEGVIYSNSYNFTQVYHGALLDQGDLLIFGQTRGHLLLQDGTTRASLGGIFADEGIPTTTNSVFFYGLVTLDGTFTLLDYLVSNSGNDAYISDIYALGNDEFILTGRTQFITGIFDGILLNQNDSASYVLHLAVVNDELIQEDIHQFNTTNSFIINRTFLNDNLLVFNGHATGSIDGQPSINYGGNISYPFFMGFNVDTWTLEWITAVDELKVDRNTDANKYINALNVVLGHEGTFLGVSQWRMNDSSSFTTFITEISADGDIIEVYTHGEVGTNSTYFIGRTETGYFTLGNTRATSGPYAAAGQDDLLLTLLNKDFEITSFEVWGGEGFDAMASWPTVLNSGILVFAANTNSATGNLATALNKTDTTPTSFLIVLS